MLRRGGRFHAIEHAEHGRLALIVTLDAEAAKLEDRRRFVVVVDEAGEVQAGFFAAAGLLQELLESRLILDL